MSREEVTLISEAIKPVAIAIIKVSQSVNQSVSQLDSQSDSQPVSKILW